MAVSVIEELLNREKINLERHLQAVQEAITSDRYRLTQTEAELAGVEDRYAEVIQSLLELEAL
jgi:hypothetical protein